MTDTPNLPASREELVELLAAISLMAETLRAMATYAAAPHAALIEKNVTNATSH